MRIATWNMNHCMRSKNARAKAWDYLANELHADVALVQEAVPPDQHVATYRAIDPASPNLNWGSAIVLLNEKYLLHPRPRIPMAECYLKPPTGEALPDTHPGTNAVADVVNEKGKVLFTAVSMYAAWEVMPKGRNMYACPRFHRIVSDLTPVFASAKRVPVLMAGDLNMSTQWISPNQPNTEARAAAAAFQRLRAWDMIDCIEQTRASRPQLENCSCGGGNACSHVQTFRSGNRKDGHPTQLDYVFASDSLVRAMQSCRVVHDEAAWALSDHCPIVVELGV